MRMPTSCIWSLALAASLTVTSRGDDLVAEPDVEAEYIAAAGADAGYVSYFDAARLAEALQTLDAGGVTDVALQLAEGERVLLRPHSGGVTAAALLEVALRLATDSGDGATLDRIGRAAAQLKLAELEARIAAARALGQANRSTPAGPNVPIAELHPTTLEVYRWLQDQIRLASAIGDRDTLQELHDTAPEYADLTDALQQAIQAEAKTALAALPAAAPEDADQANGLTDPARAGGGSTTIPKPPPRYLMLRKLAGAARSTGTLAIKTDGSSVGAGNLNAEIASAGLVPVSKCNLRNALKSDVTFKCVGTGKSYTLKPGQSMNFTIWGKITSKPEPLQSYGVEQLAIPSSLKMEKSRVQLPYLSFYTYGAGEHHVVVPNGNLSISMERGGFYVLRKR